jgi:hypothetical protein
MVVGEKVTVVAHDHTRAESPFRLRPTALVRDAPAE